MKNTKRKTKNSSTNAKITKNMTFVKIMQKSPEAAWILMEKGMHCMGCSMAGNETLEQGAVMHGLDADELVKEINNKINKKGKKKK
jgi:hybrid cluster-associated redox disulfide protein